MTDNEKTRLKNAETNVKTLDANVKALEKRIISLEEEMAVCLRFIRIQAEKLAKEKDSSFKSRPVYEA